MLTLNKLILHLVLYPRWNTYFPNIKTLNIFSSFRGAKYFMDSENLYFYSKEELDLEFKNVGGLNDKMKLYKLPIDIRVYQVLRNATKIEHICRLYDTEFVSEFKSKYYKEFEKYELNYLIDLLEGKHTYDEQLNEAVYSEDYELAAEIRDIINLSFLKPLFHEISFNQ